MGKFFKAFKWIKPEDFENLTKIPKHDKQTSLIFILSPDNISIPNVYLFQRHIIFYGLLNFTESSQEISIVEIGFFFFSDL